MFTQSQVSLHCLSILLPPSLPHSGVRTKVVCLTYATPFHTHLFKYMDIILSKATSKSELYKSA